MKKIKVGSNEIAYKDSGSGETVVLLHGFCGSISYWDKVIPLLSNEYRVIAMDLRGHGNSSSNVSPFTIDDMAKDVKELLESLQLGQIYLFGHSLGGYITLSLAEHYPEKLKGYGLIHSTAFPDTEEGKKGRENAVNSIEKSGLDQFIDGLVPKLFSDESLLNLREDVDKTKQIGYSTNIKAAQSTLLAMKSRPDRTELLSRKDIPLLLVAGALDKIIPVKNTISVEEEHIQTKVIQTSGHMSMYENPDELVETIREFLVKQKN
jgi:3-oxoadipate enol-lactonase